MLKDLTSEKLIRLQIEADNWEDAVRKAAEPLEDEGKIKASYIDAIIDSVKPRVHTLLSHPHVALPHAGRKPEPWKVLLVSRL